MNHHDDPKRALHKAIWLPCSTLTPKISSWVIIISSCWVCWKCPKGVRDCSLISWYPKDLLLDMEIKLKYVLLLHRGRVIKTGTKIKLLGGTVTLAVSRAGKVVPRPLFAPVYLDYLVIVILLQVPMLFVIGFRKGNLDLK